MWCESRTGAHPAPQRAPLPFFRGARAPPVRTVDGKAPPAGAPSAWEGGVHEVCGESVRSGWARQAARRGIRTSTRECRSQPRPAELLRVRWCARVRWYPPCQRVHARREGTGEGAAAHRSTQPTPWAKRQLTTCTASAPSRPPPPPPPPSPPPPPPRTATEPDGACALPTSTRRATRARPCRPRRPCRHATSPPHGRLEATAAVTPARHCPSVDQRCCWRRCPQTAAAASAPSPSGLSRVAHCAAGP